MTRTGKSNTTKIIAKSVFELRKKEGSGNPLRIGQVIFDPNGEYANENIQDKGALKSIWKLIPKAKKENEVVTYGITSHPNDPDRILMKLNFYLDDNLQIGKEIIDSLLNKLFVVTFRPLGVSKPARTKTERYANIRRL